MSIQFQVDQKYVMAKLVCSVCSGSVWVESPGTEINIIESNHRINEFYIKHEKCEKESGECTKLKQS